MWRNILADRAPVRALARFSSFLRTFEVARQTADLHQLGGRFLTGALLQVPQKLCGDFEFFRRKREEARRSTLPTPLGASERKMWTSLFASITGLPTEVRSLPPTDDHTAGNQGAEPGARDRCRARDIETGT